MSLPTGVQVANWFTDCEATTGVAVCRVKNGFASHTAKENGERQDGGVTRNYAEIYPDLKLFVLFEGICFLRIIGEIQVKIGKTSGLFTN